MKLRLLGVLAACAASTAMAQTNPVLPPEFTVSLGQRVREYFQLTEAQVKSIADNKRKHIEWTVEKQMRVAQVQREIFEETHKQTVDPLALGQRYAEIESICREMRSRSTELNTANANVLTPAQKVKLKALEDALALLPTIAETQFADLLAAPSYTTNIAPQFPIGLSDAFSRTDGTHLGITGPSATGCGFGMPYRIIRVAMPGGGPPVTQPITGSGSGTGTP
ncbi:MAG TPA: hypothetical protein VER03_21710 [Bryobacteraceae bacterium]|nr:hypothetical protein [Bryobacteraceae bacterium]